MKQIKHFLSKWSKVVKLSLMETNPEKGLRTLSINLWSFEKLLTSIFLGKRYKNAGIILDC